MRIAYLDDDATYTVLVCASFRRLGHEIDAFGLPDDALKALVDRRYDAFVSDYRMPLTSGIIVIARARSIRPELPCALISGFLRDVSQPCPIEGVVVRGKPQSLAEFAALAGDLLPAA